MELAYTHKRTRNSTEVISMKDSDRSITRVIGINRILLRSLIRFHHGRSRSSSDKISSAAGKNIETTT
jgi:hypothetical protein